MKPTKIMPYVVVIEDEKGQQLYTFRTEAQAKKFSADVQVGTHFKVATYVSIKIAERKKKK